MRKAALFALSLLGLFDSSYLWWVYTSPSHPMACLGTGCDVVRASSYARVLGLPLPSYGAAMYAALALLIFAQALASTPLERGLRFAVGLISGAGFFASLYLTGVEAFVIHAWCVWCVVSALAVTVIFALVLFDLAHPASHLFISARSGDRNVVLRPAWTYVIVLMAAIVSGVPAFLFLSRHGEPPPGQPAPLEALASRLVRPESHLTGNLGAPVTVVEFADFECPYCGQAEKTVREIRQKYGNEMRFVFRHFPQPRLHPLAEKAAEASECAAEQGKFWEAAEKFYDQQNDLSPAALERYAQELGLDLDRFRQCLSSGRPTARVQQDVEDARALGIRWTPTFIIGQRKIEGALELAQFSKLIDQELASRGPSPGTQAPVSATPQPVADSKSAAPNPFINSPGGLFTQLRSSAIGCSEEEAAKQQPDLIRTPEARRLFEGRSKALFVDVRPLKDFSSGRIRGALNVPVDEIEQRWSQLPKNQNIVLYESGTSSGDVCASSRAAGRVLLAHGFSRDQVKVYQDGMSAWKRVGLPIEP